MKKIVTLCLAALLFSPAAFATGAWVNNVQVLGLNANGDWQSSNEFRIKLSSAGSTSCQVVKFKPGQGNLPNSSVGEAARDRIYSAALSAYIANKSVSVWVYDTTGCYGLMLTIGSEPF